MSIGFDLTKVLRRRDYPTVALRVVINNQKTWQKKSHKNAEKTMKLCIEEKDRDRERGEREVGV